MTDRIDPVPFWTRELTQLRGKALRLRGRPESRADHEVIEAALAACDSLLRELAAAHLECERLRVSGSADTAAWERLFDIVPCAWLSTDSAGLILDANELASALLNVSIRHLRGRQLWVYTNNRKVFADLLARLNHGQGPEEATLKLRPRDRRPVDVDVIVMPGPPNQPGVWRWFIGPCGQFQTPKSEETADASQSMQAPG
jgi:PAS domain-containing protein